MVTISAAYRGGLRCVATHCPSGGTLHTDAPVDNQGRGESFSPTDLVATARGTCILTTVAIVADRRDIDLSGAEAAADKHMIADPLRRIGRPPVRETIPAAAAAGDDRRRLETAARTCPVHESLLVAAEADIEIVWA